MSTSRTERLSGVFMECSNPNCLFRFADTSMENETGYCPKCGQQTFVRAGVFPDLDKDTNRGCDSPQVTALLDNVRSVYNVGSIIRTCEGLGIQSVFMAGITPTPDHPKLRKTALGAEQRVSWEYWNNALALVEQLKRNGYGVIGLENDHASQPIQEFQLEPKAAPICLIVGNERLGIDPHVRALCDRLLSIPMRGGKESLNVSVAFAIGAYVLTEALRARRPSR